MIRIKSLAAASALAVVALASGVASAADVSQSAQTLSLGNGATYFGHTFDVATAGDTFADRFNFSSAGNVTLGSIVSAFTSPLLSDAIQITNFQVFNSAGFSLDGTKWSEGVADVWSAASAGTLAADSYYVLVSGKLLSTAATAYSGSLTVTAVPEPETFAMLAAGLGLIGFAGRRRNKQAQKLS
jgi:hypothetical protein